MASHNGFITEYGQKLGVHCSSQTVGPIRHLKLMTPLVGCGGTGIASHDGSFIIYG